MNPLNKFESIGIFASVAVMAIALVVIRFGSDTFSKKPVAASSNNVASIVTVRGDEKEEVENALKDSMSSKAELKKLIVNDVTYGVGVAVKKGDTVTVHYKGTLADGRIFDESRVRGEPFTFTVGKGMVIKGWDEGLVGMQVGGERILVIPPEMAYGNREIGIIPAHATLIFAIELLAIE
jgi:FK506-binding nuclear protein